MTAAESDNPPITAADVRDALTSRWPDSEYLSIDEAPQSSDRSGRKLDRLVISLWRSRGLEIDGIEIKVTRSDWLRELREPAKADWWHTRVHRFWIAAPPDVVKLDELPTGWGLLVVKDGRTRQARRPAKSTPVPLTWPQTVGLMRATADAGQAALWRAEQRGYDRGFEIAKREVEGGRGYEVLQAKHQQLVEAVREFEATTGLRLSGAHAVTPLAEAVRTVMDWSTSPETIARRITSSAAECSRVVDQLSALAATVDALRLVERPPIAPEVAP